MIYYLQVPAYFLNLVYITNLSLSLNLNRDVQYILNLLIATQKKEVKLIQAYHTSPDICVSI